MKQLILIIFLVCFVSAKTFVCDSCTRTEFSDSLAEATTGDIIELGSGTCEWGTSITIDKEITIRGQGPGTDAGWAGVGATDSTVIINTTSTPNSGLFNFANYTNTKQKQRMSNMRIECDRNNNNSVYHLYYQAEEHEIVIDSIIFKYGDFSPGTQYVSKSIRIGTFNSSNMYGLIHSCFFDSAAKEVIWLVPDGDNWQESDLLGSRNMLFVENCKFLNGSGGHIITGDLGAKFVCRKDSMWYSDIDMHGYCFNDYSSYVFEVYDNFISSAPNPSTSGVFFTGINVRGGTGVVYNNFFTPQQSFGPQAHYYRASRSYCPAVPGCAGTNEGYPALYQPGRGRNQRLRPIYLWNNTDTSQTPDTNVTFLMKDVSEDCGEFTSDYMTDGVDYYDQTIMPGYVAYLDPHPLVNPNASLCYIDSVASATDTISSAAGQTVTIYGENMGSSAGTIYLGDSTAASYTSWTATEITFTTKASQTGIQSVYIRPTSGDAYILDNSVFITGGVVSPSQIRIDSVRTVD